MNRRLGSIRWLAYPLLAVVLVTLAALAVAQPESETMRLFDFEESDGARWTIVNDGVMGGRSQGFGAIEDGVMRFEGTLVTRGGGFTSVRAPRRVDLSAYDGLELRIRGNGRQFEVEANDGTRYGWREVSRRAPFETSEDWRVVRVPFSAFRSTVFGEPVSAEALDPSAIQRIGIYILDGIDGPFWLEVDRIGAYVEE